MPLSASARGWGGHGHHGGYYGGGRRLLRRPLRPSRPLERRPLDCRRHRHRCRGGSGRQRDAAGADLRPPGGLRTATHGGVRVRAAGGDRPGGDAHRGLRRPVPHALHPRRRLRRRLILTTMDASTRARLEAGLARLCPMHAGASNHKF
ncbi:hypothetical protein LSPH26S_03841 [Lysinibacillus sphaericus]